MQSLVFHHDAQKTARNLFLILLGVMLVLGAIPLTARATENPVLPTVDVESSTIDCFGIVDVTLTIEGENLIQSGPTVDLMFVLDESGSISASEFELARQAMLDMVAQLPIGADGYAVGLSAFGSTGRLVSDLSTDPSVVNDAISTVDHLGGWTNTYQGVKIAEERLTESLVARADATKIIITITDGIWNRDASSSPPMQGLTEPLLEDIQSRPGWLMFGVGIGGQILESNILLLSSEPDETFAYPIPDYEALADTLLEIVEDIVSPAATNLEYNMTAGADFDVVSATASKGIVNHDASGLSWTLDTLQTETVAITYQLEHQGGADGLTSIHGSALLEWMQDESPALASFDDVEVTVEGCDTTAPETTADLAGTEGNNDWWVSPVTVTLNADDGDGSGVKEITYSATGANVISETTVAGETAQFTLTEDGETTLTFYAEDNVGNVEVAQELDVKIDQTDPVLNLSGDLEANGTSPAGANVVFSAIATDATSGLADLECSAESGDLFPNGTTVVECTATDNAENDASGSFSITVLDADDQLLALIQYLTGSDVPNGFKNSRLSQLNSVASSLDQGDEQPACNQLGAFINSVDAQSGKQISTELAGELIDQAEAIKAALGC